MILVTGATGFIGRALMRHLLESGRDVRMMIRPSRRTPRLPKGRAIDVAVVSQADERAIRAALMGVDVIIHLAGAESQGRNADLLAMDMRGTEALEEAGPSDLAFLTSERNLKSPQTATIGALLVGRRLPDCPSPQLVVDNPAYAFARAAQQFFARPTRMRGIAQGITRGEDVTIGADVSIWPGVTLGDRVSIGARVTLYPGVFIGDDSVIGDDALLYPNVVVREGCRLGARVIVHSGTVIGSDGFGYVQYQGRHQKIPQLGGVLIEDDVELGSNVSIDRATFGNTVIKRGTKIDNLVQIAHNVTVGEHNILVAQVGIAGSTTQGKYVMVGGQAGLTRRRSEAQGAPVQHSERQRPRVDSKRLEKGGQIRQTLKRVTEAAPAAEHPVETGC